MQLPGKIQQMKSYRPSSSRICEKIVATDDTVQRAQRLRLQRFGMSVATFVFVLLAMVLITRLGLGEMNRAQWAQFIGLGLFGVSVFSILFYTKANLNFSEPSLDDSTLFNERRLLKKFWDSSSRVFLPRSVIWSNASTCCRYSHLKTWVARNDRWPWSSNHSISFSLVRSLISVLGWYVFIVICLYEKKWTPRSRGHVYNISMKAARRI